MKLVGLCIAVAVGLAWLADPHTRLRIQLFIIKGNLFSAVLMSELFVAMIVLSVGVGLPWKPHAARIAQGLSIYSVIDFLVETGHSYFGLSLDTRTYHDLSHVRIAVYDACAAYWIVALWRHAPPPRELSDRIYKEMSALQVLVGSQLQSLRSRR